jgi:hypothetical protein
MRSYRRYRLALLDVFLCGADRFQYTAHKASLRREILPMTLACTGGTQVMYAE